jgi:hypothetical protein
MDRGEKTDKNGGHLKEGQYMFVIVDQDECKSIMRSGRERMELKVKENYSRRARDRREETERKQGKGRITMRSDCIKSGKEQIGGGKEIEEMKGQWKGVEKAERNGLELEYWKETGENGADKQRRRSKRWELGNL